VLATGTVGDEGHISEPEMPQLSGHGESEVVGREAVVMLMRCVGAGLARMDF
jgi:hypothetical protein